MPADQSLAEALVLEPGVTCLDRALLLDQLESWIGAARIDLHASIRVRGSASDPRALQYTVKLGDELFERPFESAPEDCAGLHAAVSLSIAVALDNALAVELGILDAEPPSEQTEPQAQVEPQAQEPIEDEDPNADPTPTPGPRPRRGPALAVTAAGGVFAGLTPRLSAGGLASLDIRPRDHFDLRLGVLTTHLPRFGLDAGEVAVTLAAGRLDLCWGTEPLAIRLRVCGGVAGGAVVSQGRGFNTNFRRTTPWFAGLVGVDVAVHLVGPLALELRIDAVVALQRTRLDVRDDDEDSKGRLLDSERFPPAGLLVGVGPRVEF